MNVLFYSAQPYDIAYFNKANAAFNYNLRYLEYPLNADNTALIKPGESVICAFVNDHLDAGILRQLKEKGIQLIALRAAGFNNVDLKVAAELNLPVVRVPAYSPHAVAEHAVALLLGLNRKIYKAYNRIRDNNFTLNGLEGFDLYGKTVGVVGTGNIGAIFCRIMLGFGCKVLAYDMFNNKSLEDAGVEYVSMETILKDADIISLHCPLTPETKHLVNAYTISQMKRGVFLLNTSRGGLIDTKAVVEALKNGHIGALAIDVYEQEENLFFHDLSDVIIQDDVWSRLITFPNVVITSHQGFFTREALTQIAETTLNNIQQFEKGLPLTNQVKI
ncbi:2-hydroxyacid dehydrogenase [Chitinophaga sp. Cy-1792]|uniref:2-hydroxyacid dehydrogenase n=1 Tax=Chitinophaga sp. Cy-1792 TaxID=2608339 RepID=UPI0014230888|nr:2-hydroxyacid dehydrogenase [Chitinophaga sp. Cy-1792]NIG52868.1 2-hydroxyacid dehydrogenase [Chitinophaga sp. Cy-1792]